MDHSSIGGKEMKTDRQALLEVQRGKPIEDVVREALEKYRGRKSQVALAGFDMGITDASVYNWCEQLGIDIKDYQQPEAAEKTAQEAREKVLREGAA